mgnify:FL=1
MRKKIATLLLALVMCLSLCTPAMATKSPLGKSETADNTALVVSDDVTARIFGKYAKEIELIEDYAGRSVTHLTRDNLNVIKYVAALHHDDDEYDFPALMTDLAVACTEARLGVNTQAAPDGETNGAVTVLAANDILAGKHIRDVTVGATTTITGTSSISLSAGSTVNGVQLTTGYSQSFSYSVEGPGDGLTLNNGAIVSHRTCFAVLYGTIVQTAFGRRYIDPDTATIVDYTLLASIGVPTYCGQARHGGTLYFSGPYAYRSAFESHPSPFI